MCNCPKVANSDLKKLSANVSNGGCHVTKELHNLYSSPSTVKAIKSKRI
jgi:hypothetical protein